MCNDGLMKRSLDSDKILLDNLEYDAAETTDVRRTNEDSNQMTKAADSAVQETRRAIVTIYPNEQEEEERRRRKKKEGEEKEEEENTF
ncbi:hypothetical protein HZH66_015382 [Vespula vulgaris]|uniref:Uncharacterized protein n=1 Tax=Vespula vulgaris TaxID=7454 RepID=A0A834IXU7_VESVU|nr:hypothetical protein HZH66_015382 [Vespula vulgaris]